MGIYDREYYRRATSRSHWVTGQAPVVKWLIIINIIVLVLQFASPAALRTVAWRETRGDETVWVTQEAPTKAVTKWLAVDPLRYWEAWRWVTGTFCHSLGLWHILFNMWFLWLFGRELEGLYGSREFLAFYLGAGIVSSLGFIGMSYVQGTLVQAVGASGAVMGVVVLFTLYYPRRPLAVFFVVLEMRWWALIFIGLDLLAMNNLMDNVAHSAHLAGAAYGALYKVLDLRFSRLFRGQFRLPSFRLPRRRPRMRVLVPPEEPEMDRQVDEVLAKISREGAGSLTDRERKILEQASRHYKQRRQ